MVLFNKIAFEKGNCYDLYRNTVKRKKKKSLK